MPPSASGAEQPTPLTLPPEIRDLSNHVDTDYGINGSIGKGATSDVWLCALNTSGGPCRVAVKKFRPVGDTTVEKITERFIREVNAWYQLQKDRVHPHITELLGVVDIKLGNGRPGIVLPYYEDNDALKFIQKGNFNESKKGEIVWNIAKGLEHIHFTCDSVHGDMKLRNILFDKNGSPKICDFGLSRIMDTTGFTTTTPSFTISYAAPEIVEKSLNFKDDGSEKTSKPPKFTSKEADIYAFAILTAEIFMEEQYTVYLSYQRNNRRPSKEKVNSPKYFPLLEDCWKTNPDERPPIGQITRALARIAQ